MGRKQRATTRKLQCFEWNVYKITKASVAMGTAAGCSVVVVCGVVRCQSAAMVVAMMAPPRCVLLPVSLATSIAILLWGGGGAEATGTGARTIGVALPSFHISSSSETTVFEHGVMGGAGQPGYLSHFWATGAPVQQDATVRIYVDHESVASVEYSLLMAHSVGWLDSDPCGEPSDLAHGANHHGNGSCDAAAYGVGSLSGGEPWDAGGLFGKTGARGGLWNNFKVSSCA
jgi:hypothetical protein